MIKKDLIDEVSDKTGLNKSIVRYVVESFLNELRQGIAEGKRVELRGFGVFEVRKVRSRRGRNMQTGEEVSIPEREKVVFKTSKIFYEK